MVKAQLFSNPHGIGLAVMTSTNRMFLVSNVSEPKLRTVPDVPSKYKIKTFLDLYNFYISRPFQKLNIDRPYHTISKSSKIYF